MQSLPIDAHVGRIVATLQAQRAAVLVAPPGAGKTTRVPPALIDDGPVLLLQPRDEALQVAERARRLATESNDPGSAALVPQIGLSIQTYRELKEQGVAASDIFNDPNQTKTEPDEQEGDSAEPSAEVPVGNPGQ